MKNISKKPIVPVRRSVSASPAYRLAWVAEPPLLSADWDDPVWATAQTLQVANFHPASSNHRPRTEARALYGQDGLYVSFRVQDRYVRSIHTAYQSRVSLDSCVEFFVQPKPDSGYFNFEINCGGTLLLYYIEDPARAKNGLFKKYREVPAEIAKQVRIHHSMPPVTLREIQEPVQWQIAFFAPFAMFEHFIGSLPKPHLQPWRGNFFKCGDETSHPHWASWAPIGEVLRFHQPDRFENLEFAPPVSLAKRKRSPRA